MENDVILKRIKSLTSSPLLRDQMIGYVNAKQRMFMGLNDLQRANLFWDKSVRNEQRISHPQRPDCAFTIVIPVYNEKKQRILRQIDSLRRQREIAREAFEVIYIVNNGPCDNTAKWLEAFTNNTAILEEIDKITDINVFAIDKSSSGNEIPHCNVGKARNRVTAEASLRFFENGKNGVLIHTDADSCFDDNFYFKKLASLVQQNEHAIGMAGGLVWEFNPDGEDTEKVVQLKSKNKQLVLIKKWEALHRFLVGDEHYTKKLYRTAFWGAHMISRSYESAVVGGFFGGSTLEDELFGLELAYYGMRRGKKVIGLKDNLFLVTALRESTRTDGSIGKRYENISIMDTPSVPDDLAPETRAQFAARVTRVFSANCFDAVSFRHLLSNADGKLVVPIPVFEDMVSMLEPDAKANATRMKDISHITDVLYYILYPKKSLTQEYYGQLEKKVSESPDGEDLLRYIGYMSRNF